ncbi:50S ribosomal protein L1 [candidate division WOR-3 bacterium]|uniref:Large ribosomal subunit protein uL1 n=1 Tax=candidate division WOR-3 bacterium TaxID=2052148 RepID=A0A9D5QDV4_UNCW3|nr:50S ribosomal protein L1 [candidate division WOR-3 bacterium]MBD3364440.1 50S ribosomal protein L1 [candidate division WOR-3 bacterium]
MMTHGKRYRDLATKIDTSRIYPLAEALPLIKETSSAKFDETVDIGIKLGVDPRKADQMVRGTVSLPKGTGRKVRVLVFAKGDKEKEAKDAGADFVGLEDLAERIQGGWMDFDVAVAAPDTMSVVGKLGKLLGPRGLMPSPKAGTVTFDVGPAVTQIKQGRIQFRVDRTGNIHGILGKMSFSEEDLRRNLLAFVAELNRLRPKAFKGQYMRSVYISATMGPSIKLDVKEIAELARKQEL